MSQPANGVSFKAAGLAYLDTLRIRRGGRWALAVRDYNGRDTNISPGSAFGAPMALDGNWRDDLFAIKKDSTGKWVYNTAPNLGFYPIGSQHPDGIERAPKIDNDNLEILQSLDPARADMQKRDKTLMFTPRENNPVVHCIQYNRPLVDVLHPAAADGTYFAGESSDPEFVERQVIVMHEDKQGGKVERNAFPMPRCILTDVGSQKGNKKDVDEAKLTLTRLIDPYFVDELGVPMIDGRWVAGDLWEEGVAPALTFTTLAPLATALTATTASVVFRQPIGGVSPYTYDVERSADGVTGWTAATSSEAVSNGVVTSSVSSLTTATDYFFRAKVTDSDGTVAYSGVSNEITTP